MRVHRRSILLLPVGEPVQQRVQHGDPSIAYLRHVIAGGRGRLLRHSVGEGQVAQIAEHVDQVFWMSDPHKSQVLYVSPAYEEVWGRTCQSLYDEPRSFLDAIHPDDRDRVMANSLGRQARGEAADVEYRVVRPDGLCPVSTR